MLEYFLIARILDVANDTGSVFIKSFTNDERFNNLGAVFVEVFGSIQKLSIEKVEVINSNIAVKFENFNSNDEVKFLNGCNIFIEKENTVELDSDTFFIHDLISSEIYISDKFFGKIVDVLNLPANDVYVISDINGEEVLIPALKKNFEKVDIEKKMLFLKKDGDWRYDDED